MAGTSAGAKKGWATRKGRGGGVAGKSAGVRRGWEFKRRDNKGSGITRMGKEKQVASNRKSLQSTIAFGVNRKTLGATAAVNRHDRMRAKTQLAKSKRIKPVIPKNGHTVRSVNAMLNWRKPRW